MANTPTHVMIAVEVQHIAPTEIVAKVAEEFAEWLELQGFRVDLAEDRIPDERSYQELAEEFARSWAEQTA